MNAGGPVGGSARSVMREIDHELSRLERWQKAAASERELLLSARAVLATKADPGPVRRQLSQKDVAAYLAAHPGSWPAHIAAALHVPATNVSTRLYRGRHKRREDGWYLRSGIEAGQS
jgi:hypothetical protein